jgi:hypothetical protein
MGPFQSREARDEARNPKLETNPKAPNSNVFSWFAVFVFLNFEFVSNFDIRISDFSMLEPVWFGLGRVR